MTAVTLSSAGLLLAGCDRSAPYPAPANVQTETPRTLVEAPVPAVPAPLPALTRGDIVSAAGQAASAYSEGRALTSADPLVGRSFAVRVPFGCTGPTPPEVAKDERDGLAGWSWGPDRKTIRLSMRPDDWTGSAMLAEVDAAGTWEAVEGFWIPRPWLASESCPKVQTDPLQTAALPPSPQTVGLAAVFEAGGSRFGRRNGRAYDHMVGAKDDAPPTPPASGYRMLLEGRVAAFPDGRAIACRASSPDQRPVCIVAIKLDRVAYEDASDDALSEWRPG